ncbi:RHS repeat domain-containing protein [Chitinophaga qingshengii]|uniref:RHS repeat protein n=1 Tax=Chitinophaga qingshengii TaxID=1569794 RepID=A0ABR7TIS4_9BACT|nr:RHS repeat domain-containing protein [Chitinophaga qingshengii]MBC9930406.1 RHS repeat protein [Chitinophaga qingshengii]
MIPFVVKNGVTEQLANREADSAYVTAGLLNKIEYPTGGYTQFQFEGNEYSYIGSSQLVPAPIEKEGTAAGFLTYEQNKGPGQVKTTFVIDKWQQGSIEWQISNCIPSKPGCASWASMNPEATIELRRIGGGTPFHAYGMYVDKYTSGLNYIDLQPGTYELILKVVNPYDRANADVFYTYTSSEMKPPVRPAGGVRIARIISYDGISHDHDMVRSYSYKMDDPMYSSGVTLEQPKYDYSYTEYVPEPTTGQQCGKQQSYNCYSSVSSVVLGSTQGGVVGYRRVTEYYNTKDSSNKIVSYFTSAVEHPDDGVIYAPPYTPGTSYDWRRGLLTQKITYGKDNKVVSIEKKVYTVLPDFQYELRNFKAQQTVFCVASPIGTDGKDKVTRYKTDYYRTVTEWMPLTSDTTILFSSGSTDAIRNITTYAYDTSSLNVSSVTKEMSSRTVQQFYRYPNNYQVIPGDNLSLGIINLQQRHIISPVIETYTVVSNNANPGTIFGQFVSYKPSQPYPESVFRLSVPGVLTDFNPSSVSGGGVTMDRRYEPRLIFDLYDAAGNVLQQHKVNDEPESFIWGYGNSYPVAAIKGMSYSAVSGLVNVLAINNLYNETQIRNSLAPLRTLDGAMSTIYTFRPQVGMTSMTDPSGRTIYYEYDGFGRLTVIRDKDGKILKQTDYKYQRPVTE